MVAITYPSPRSSTFVFIISPSARKYPISSSLLASLSPIFASMVNYDSRTAFATSCVYLPDCDTSTFDRFVAFLHTGDFPSPLFLPIPSAAKPRRYRAAFLPPEPFGRSPAMCRAFAAFAASKRYYLPRRLVRYDNGDAPWVVDDADTFALCAVARVYLLARRYGVTPLARLCLHKIHRLVVCVREIWDGVAFLRLCVLGPKDCPSPLRELAFLYCLFHYANLERRHEFAAFVKEAPGFALAILDELAKHRAADADELAECRATDAHVVDLTLGD